MKPQASVLILSHTQEIVKQDYESLLDFFPSAFIGIYSAGLNKKQIRKITVGGIQSVWRKPGLFKDTDLVIVDECHCISHNSTGMYRKFFKAIPARITGMSATCFRLGHGLIYEGKDALFDSIAYDLTAVDKFNELVRDGYLTKLVSVSPSTRLSVDGVKKVAGEYNLKQLAKKVDQESLTKDIIVEVIKYGKNYKKWLVFAVDIAHSEHIAKELTAGGIKTAVLHSKVEGDRDEIIRKFKEGEVRALVSISMVSVGFDVPDVDLIALLRPTMSPVFHVQSVGRGLRVAPNKDHCLVLDFAGNTARLGPINDVKIPEKKGKGGGEAPTKTCPECSTIMYAIARECETCGYEFEFQTKLELKASEADIVADAEKDKKQWMKVSRVQYATHTKTGRPDSLLVVYHCGLSFYKEWICLGHQGYAKQKADHWARYRGHTGEMNVSSVFAGRKSLRVPEEILVDFSGKYHNIVDAKFNVL